MASVVLPNPNLEASDVQRFLEERFTGKYQVASSGALNVDFDVFPSSWYGAAVKVKPAAEGTTVRVFGNVPKVWARLLSMILVLLPGLYLMLVVARPVVKDVVEALRDAPELNARETQADADPEPPTPE